MRKEDKSYIKSYLCKVVNICVCSNCTEDKFGNVTFKNVNALKQTIDRLILEATDKLNIEESEVREYLLLAYKEKSENPEFTNELKEVISFLEFTEEKGTNKKEDTVSSKEDDIERV